MEKQTQSPASKELAIINETIPTLVKELGDRMDKAVAGMSSVTVIEDEETAKKANNILVKVRKTRDIFMTKRKAITSNLDIIKSELMKFEKEVDSDHSGSSAFKLKGMYKNYQTALLKKNREEEAKIELEKLKSIQTTEYKTKIREAVASNKAQMLNSANNTISEMLAGMTLETSEAIIKKLKYTPSLKEELYDKFFSFEYNFGERVLSDEELKTIIAEMKEELSYTQIAGEYSTSALEFLAEWAVKFNEKAKMLKTASEAAPEEKAQIETNIAKKEEIDTEKMKSTVADAEKAEIQGIQNTKLEANIDAEIKSQVQTQGSVGEEVKGTKQYYFTDEKNWEKTFVEVVASCVHNAGFPDIVKTDGGSARAMKAGAPLYKTQIQWWLDYFAKHGQVDVKNMSFVEEAKITNRAKA